MPRDYIWYEILQTNKELQLTKRNERFTALGRVPSTENSGVGEYTDTIRSPVTFASRSLGSAGVILLRIVISQLPDPAPLEYQIRFHSCLK